MESAEIGHDALVDLASEETFQAPDDLSLRDRPEHDPKTVVYVTLCTCLVMAETAWVEAAVCSRFFCCAVRQSLFR